MLQILLLILKIIGIVLLVIVGIVLFALISVLVVPIRYSADGSGHFSDDEQNFNGHALVSWFLHAVTVRLSYEENKLLVKVKLFFFTLYEMTIPEEGQAGAEGGQSSGGWSSETGQGTVTAAGEPANELSERREETESVKAEAETQVSPPEETVIREEKPETAPEEVTGESPGERTSEESDKGNSRKKKSGKKVKEKRPGFFERILNSFNDTMTRVFDEIDRIFDWLGRLLSGEIKIIPEDNAVTRLMNFWQDDANKATVRLLIAQIKKLFKHILPREAAGSIRAGFDDPSMTGTMLAVIAPFYGLYGKSFAIEPSFNETVLEGDIKLKGHIRAITLIWIVLYVFTDRNFRRILSDWRKGGTGNG